MLKSGTDSDIFKFIKEKNIFDRNIFDIELVLWKLKDKKFFEDLILILKARSYYNSLIWSFAFYHKDQQLIMEFQENENHKGFSSKKLELPILEYFPYYSSRVHKFLNESKSTIRVKEFKETYTKFLYSGIFERQFSCNKFKITFIYYLLLQDRLKEAKSIFSKLSAQ